MEDVNGEERLRLVKTATCPDFSDVMEETNHHDSSVAQVGHGLSRTKSEKIGATKRLRDAVGTRRRSVCLSFDNLGSDVIQWSNNDECGLNSSSGLMEMTARPDSVQTNGMTSRDKLCPLIKTKHSVLIKGRLNLGRERLI